MKNKILLPLFSFFLLAFLFIAASKNVNYGDETEGYVELEHGNGAVINIWIDSYSRLDVLKNHNVKYLFVDVGDTINNGGLKTPRADMKWFLDFTKEYEASNNYDFILLPYSEINTDYYNIKSKKFQNNLINDYVYMNRLGFDGILVDVENIKLDERADYLTLLENLRVKLPKQSIISAYAGSLSYSQDNTWEWDSEFYRSVSERVDIISAPGYDTSFENEEDYKNYVKNQVSGIVSENFSSNFLFAVPTHKPYPETIENALGAYTEEISKYPDNKFLGVTVFAEWTADENEWDVFEKYINN